MTNYAFKNHQDQNMIRSDSFVSMSKTIESSAVCAILFVSTLSLSPTTVFNYARSFKIVQGGKYVLYILKETAIILPNGVVKVGYGSTTSR
jgi:hypothetical protein